MTISRSEMNKALKGKSRKEQKALVRSHAPDLIAEIRREARRQLEAEGLIGAKLKMRKKISARAGIKDSKK